MLPTHHPRCEKSEEHNVDKHLFSFITGESAVGKSSLVLRFVKGQFHEYQESTIGGMKKFLFIIVKWGVGQSCSV